MKSRCITLELSRIERDRVFNRIETKILDSLKVNNSIMFTLLVHYSYIYIPLTDI